MVDVCPTEHAYATLASVATIVAQAAHLAVPRFAQPLVGSEALARQFVQEPHRLQHAATMVLAPTDVKALVNAFVPLDLPALLATAFVLEASQTHAVAMVVAVQSQPLAHARHSTAARRVTSLALVWELPCRVGRQRSVPM
jgi:hypothetical protein